MPLEELQHAAGKAPVVILNRLPGIFTFEVQEMELERLDEVVAAENKAIAFTTFMAGLFVSALLGWLGSNGLSAVAYGVYVAAIGSTGALTVWFGLEWRKAQKARPKLLDSIRRKTQSRSVEVIASHPQALRSA